jgi:hypothetical protein
MMREPQIPDDAQVVTIDVGMEIYLRQRPDPLHILGTFQFNASHLDHDDLLESFMAIVTHTCKNVLNSKDELRFVLSDRNANKFIIEAEEIQAISLLAPSLETIVKAVEDSK